MNHQRSMESMPNKSNRWDDFRKFVLKYHVKIYHIEFEDGQQYNGKST